MANGIYFSARVAKYLEIIAIKHKLPWNEQQRRALGRWLTSTFCLLFKLGFWLLVCLALEPSAYFSWWYTWLLDLLLYFLYSLNGTRVLLLCYCLSVYTNVDTNVVILKHLYLACFIKQAYFLGAQCKVKLRIKIRSTRAYK